MNVLILERQREPENSLLVTQARTFGIRATVSSPENIDALFSGGKPSGCLAELVAGYDALLIRSYWRFALIREVAREFSAAGKPVWGLSVEHAAYTQDKFADLHDLRRSGIAVPDMATLGLLLPEASGNASIVIKPHWGFGGEGVSLAPRAAAVDPHGQYAQAYLPADSDFRVLLANGQALPYLIERWPGQDDFRTNTYQGGHLRVHPAAHSLFTMMAEISVKAGAALGRNWGGVDLRMKGNEALVLEVNRTPRLRLGKATEDVIASYWKATLAARTGR